MRLVEVHRLEDGGIEAREQLGRHDEELEVRIGIVEGLEHLLLLAAGEVVPLLELRPVVGRGGHHHRAGRFAGKCLSSSCLYSCASEAVGGHNHGLEAVRRHLFA